VVDCDDHIDCTTDACDGGFCVVLAEDAACDNGQHCDGTETCAPTDVNADPVTGCLAGEPLCVDTDGMRCTLECDEQTDTCQPSTPSDAACDNGDSCDGDETCNPTDTAADPVTGCVAGTPPYCDDAIVCTVDSCDEATDTCVHTPDDLPCADGVPCTDDFCSTQTGCMHFENDNNCQNGVFCDGAERCSPSDTQADAQGCIVGPDFVCPELDGVGCTLPACDGLSDQCVESPSDGICQNPVFCDGNEVCDPGASNANPISGCAPGSPPCDDGVDCTDDCDEQSGLCVNAPNDALCNDGSVCSGIEWCDPTSGCVADDGIQCGDAIACTVDTCVEPTGTCSHSPDHALCPPGLLCSLTFGGCIAGMPCQFESECQDETLCNGVETCSWGVCEAGTPVTCDDNIFCTVDSCDPATGQCTHTPLDSNCNDGAACTGEERCDAATGCQSGTPIDCDDSLSCTTDVCLEPTGTCAHTPWHALCSSGDPCMVSQGCSLTGPEPTGCLPETPRNCADAVACTEDRCESGVGCFNVPKNELCGCGEVCDSAFGCGSWCNVTMCAGMVYACGDCIDNDADCNIDMNDPDCLSPCDNDEAVFAMNTPGGSGGFCRSDCFYDDDTGYGNDDCYWGHKCDPLEVAPYFPPEGSKCAYDPNTLIPGTALTCSDAMNAQSTACHDYCGPLTPNGCDCFGCCEIPGAPTPVWLGSATSGTATCDLAHLADPLACKPCTIVTSCFNACDTCEICIGKPTAPPECITQQCPPGVQLCNPPYGALVCADIVDPITHQPRPTYCKNGCCVPSPM
jgi:hypothetical protein